MKREHPGAAAAGALRPAPAPVQGTPRRAAFGFVALMASLGAVNAFSVDVVIPALGEIDRDFGLADPNLRQWAVLALIGGMAPSQLLLGPVADRFGRRRAVFLGLAVCLAGVLLAALSQSFAWLLAGRALQGLGSGGLRVVGMAIVRDRFRGDEMARVVSLMNAVFIAIIFVAPFVGWLAVEAGSWRLVFWVLGAQVLATGAWFAAVQPETLDPAHRRPLSPGAVARTFREVLAVRQTRACAAALGLSLGALTAYLAMAEQLLDGVYALGALLPVAFAATSVVEGSASWLFSGAAARFGSARLARWALGWWAAAGLGGLSAFWAAWGGVPPFWLFLTWVMAVVAVLGILLGSLYAVALAPLADRAGSASSVLSACSTVAGLALGAAAGAMFDGTVLSFVGLIGVAGLGGIWVMRGVR